jgi:two-component SAPR family response regulator
MAIGLLTAGLLLGIIGAGFLKRKVISGDAPAVVADDKESDLTEPSPMENAIYLFGDFQVFDAAGHQITKLFTPLVKELFLIILLYTLKWERGISAEKLKEQLWFDKSLESARNNLAVNIAKLKNILDKINGCELSKDTGYWKIKTGEGPLYIDYLAYLSGTRQSDKATQPGMIQLSKLLQRGSFLPTDEQEWLDPFKSEIANEITDRYLHYAAAAEVKEDPGFLIRMADYLYAFDAVNEDVMRVKCRALVALGKHSLARSTFENFVREYRKLYGEDYSADFQQTIA